MASSILVSLHSQPGRPGALAILDSDSGLRYLQIDKNAPVVKMPQPRTIKVFHDLVYVTTSASFCIYRLTHKHQTAMLQLQKEVILNEWLLHDNLQANLVGIAVSEQDKRIFVGNNNFCAIDELDLEGKFVQRRHLWEIAPDIFPLPGKLPKKLSYGFIRNLTCSPDGSVFLTVANCNNSGNGKVINLKNGRELLSGLNDPHDGLFADDLFYYHDVDHGNYLDKASSGVLSAYRFQGKEKDLSCTLQWSVKPDITRSGYGESIRKLRGMAMADNTLYCGISDFGAPSEGESPAQIVAFDAETGKQKQEYHFPDLVELRQARIFAMATLPEPLSGNWSQDLLFFLHGKSTKPQYFFEDVVKPEANEEGASLITKKNQDNADNSPEAEESEEKVYIAPVKSKVPSIVIEHVSLRYRRTGTALFTFARNKHLRQSKEFLALQDLSFTFYEEETVGLIGRNGSGKSTLSMMISGALPPDNGKITTYGKVHLLALGVGFRQEMTGRDNVFISGTILGLSRREVAARMEEIKEFSELGDFFEEPLRTYSSGMRSRLGFAVATAVKPDILILDEVMSTGDAAFRKKADQRMQAMREQTKTVIIVSHNANQLKKMCTRVVWLEKGQLIMDGESKSVLAKYNKFCQNPQKWLQRHAEKPAILTD